MHTRTCHIITQQSALEKSFEKLKNKIEEKNYENPFSIYSINLQPAMWIGSEKRKTRMSAREREREGLNFSPETIQRENQRDYSAKRTLYHIPVTSEFNRISHS
jgi:hypothetical protein